MPPAVRLRLNCTHPPNNRRLVPFRPLFKHEAHRKRRAVPSCFLVAASFSPRCALRLTRLRRDGPERRLRVLTLRDWRSRVQSCKHRPLDPQSLRCCERHGCLFSAAMAFGRGGKQKKRKRVRLRLHEMDDEARAVARTEARRANTAGRKRVQQRHVEAAKILKARWKQQRHSSPPPTVFPRVRAVRCVGRKCCVGRSGGSRMRGRSVGARRK